MIEEEEHKDEHILHEGFLYKLKQKGLRLGTLWQHRYTIIDGNCRMLKYGPNEDMSQWKGVSSWNNAPLTLTDSFRSYSEMCFGETGRFRC